MKTITNTATLTGLFGEPIHVYTRAQAIENGVLVDVSTTAREAGTVWPVSMTSAAWTDCVEWTEQTESRKGYTGQSESGRLWDVVWMLNLAIRSALRRGLDASRQPLFYSCRVRTEPDPRPSGPTRSKRVTHCWRWAVWPLPGDPHYPTRKDSPCKPIATP